MTETIDLQQETKRLLATAVLRGRSLRQIATDAGVNRQWVLRYYKDETPDPGVLKVQKLHDWLVKEVAE